MTNLMHSSVCFVFFPLYNQKNHFGNIGRIRDTNCSVFPLVTEIFKKGVWTVYDSLEDPELRRLASSLPRAVLASRADSTTRKYLYGFMRWKVWAESKKKVQV